MEYQIYTKKEFQEEIFKPKIGDSLESIQVGKIDLKNLNKSEFNPLISEIPQSKMEELNQKGETMFTIVATHTIVIKT